MDRRIVIALLVVIVAVAAGMRFHGLAAQSLWNDELNTWEGTRYPGAPEISPPLYFAGMRAAVACLGESEWALRAPSAAAGTLAVLVMFLVGRRLYSDLVGLISAALMAVMWCPVYFSQEARPYALLLLTALLSTWLWIEVVGRLCDGKRPGWGSGAGYVVAAIATCYTHYFGLYLVLLQSLAAAGYVAWKRPRALGWVVALYAAVALAFLPWVPHMRSHLGIRGVKIAEPTPASAWGFLKFLAGYSEIATCLLIFAVGWIVMNAFGLAKPPKPAEGAEAEGQAPAKAAEPEPETPPRFPAADLLIMLWLVVPFAGAYLRSVTATPILSHRYLIISLPAVCLIAARAAALIPVKPLAQGCIGGGAAAALALWLMFGVNYYGTVTKESFREAAQFVVANEAKYPGALVIQHSWGRHYLDYYFERLGSPVRADFEAGLKKDVADIDDRIRARNPRYIWFVFAHRVPDREFLQHLFETYTPLDSSPPLVDAGAVVFENQRPTGPPRSMPPK